MSRNMVRSRKSGLKPSGKSCKMWMCSHVHMNTLIHVYVDTYIHIDVNTNPHVDMNTMNLNKIKKEKS